MKSEMNNQVVEHPETGRAITLFTKVDKEGIEQTYGRVRIDSSSLNLSNGFVSSKRRTAFITLDSTALKQLQGQILGGQPFPTKGKIVVIKSLFILTGRVMPLR